MQALSGKCINGAFLTFTLGIAGCSLLGICMAAFRNPGTRRLVKFLLARHSFGSIVTWTRHPMDPFT